MKQNNVDKTLYIQYIIDDAHKILKTKKHLPEKNEKEKLLANSKNKSDKKLSNQLYKARCKKMKFWKSKKRSRFSYHNDFKYACLKLWESGVSYQKISDIFGVATSTLSRWKKNFTTMFEESQPLDATSGFRKIEKVVMTMPKIEIKMITEPMREDELMLVA